MPKSRRFEVRRSKAHNLTLATLGFGLGGAALIWALLEWSGSASIDSIVQRSDAAKASDGRIWWMLLCAGAMLYYAVRAVLHLRDAAAQIVVDRDGLTLGFGRDVTIPWSSIHWIRMRGLRGTLQIGVDAEVAVALRLSLWNLDDNLTSVPGASALAIRGMGLDHAMREVGDAMVVFKPALAAARR